MKKLLLTVLSGVTIATAMLGSSASAAGNATLSMSPSATYNVGTNFSMTVTENSGADTINVAEASFSYDASKIQFVSASCGASFEIAASISANDITCATTSAKSGSQVVGTINFKAIANGTAPVTFTSGSGLYRSTDNQNIWNGNANGATTTVTTPAPVTPTPSTPTPPTNTNPTPNNSSDSENTTQADTTAVATNNSGQAATTSTTDSDDTATENSATNEATDSKAKTLGAVTNSSAQKKSNGKVWMWTGLIAAAAALAAFIYVKRVRPEPVVAAPVVATKKTPAKRTVKAKKA